MRPIPGQNVPLRRSLTRGSQKPHRHRSAYPLASVSADHRDARSRVTASASTAQPHTSARRSAGVTGAAVQTSATAEDRAIPYRLGREVAAGITGATLVPLEGSAHFAWAGDADGVVRALRAVLTAQSSPERPAEEEPAAAPLSRREREVLELLAHGLTDREIAQQLIVSPHTVHRHVANIRHKLGRGSRTAAVAEAARLGLL
jgi:ATP/maltotriose-dependent transcriptional regulator MalT